MFDAKDFFSSIRVRLAVALRSMRPRRCARCLHWVWGPSYMVGRKYACSPWCVAALRGRR